jgi:hypothetical protein
MAVLAGEQPPALGDAGQAAGAPDDDPARLGAAHIQLAQLPAAGPHRALAVSPGVFAAGAVAWGAAVQVLGAQPHHPGDRAGDAADDQDHAGIHADRAGQRAAHLGGPGQLGVAEGAGQPPQDQHHITRGEVQPGVREH